jgi:hypothetical protein
MLYMSVTGSIASSDELDDIATARHGAPLLLLLATNAAPPTLPPLHPVPGSGSRSCSVDNCSLLLLLLDDDDAVAEDAADDELLFPVDALRGFNCGACRAYRTFSSCNIL